MTTNDKIVEILKSHPEGGEKFFNALDFMLRSDKIIINDFLKFVSSEYHTLLPSGTLVNDIGFILTGQFGQVLMSNYSKELISVCKDLILVEGGLRDGHIPVIAKDSIKTKNFIILDDSYYSGRTVDGIIKGCRELCEKMPLGMAIHGVMTIYDGSKNGKHKVKSMFRYYE